MSTSSFSFGFAVATKLIAASRATVAAAKAGVSHSAAISNGFVAGCKAASTAPVAAKPAKRVSKPRAKRAVK